MESYFYLDDRAEDINQLTDALRCLKLHSFVFFGEARLDILDESLGSTLVQRCVVEQRLLDEPDQLTLSDRSIDLRLGQLEQKFQAGHLIVLL